MKQLGKNDFIKGLRNHDADQSQETEIETLGTDIISKFIQGSKTPVVGLVTPKNDRKGSCEDPHNLLTPDVGAPYVPKQISTTQHKKRPPDVLISEAITDFDMSKNNVEEIYDVRESAVATTKHTDSPKP